MIHLPQGSKPQRVLHAHLSSENKSTRPVRFHEIRHSFLTHRRVSYLRLGTKCEVMMRGCYLDGTRVCAPSSSLEECSLYSVGGPLSRARRKV